jgi:hypothetical protein
MGNEVSQPVNYNNETLNQINNILDVNTEMYQPNQVGSFTFSSGSKFMSKSQKGVSGTLREEIRNAGGVSEKIWSVVLDNGQQTVWAERDMINPQDEERRQAKIREDEERRQAIMRASEERRKEAAVKAQQEKEKRQRETEEKARASEEKRRQASERARELALEKERQRKEAAEKEAERRREYEKRRIEETEKAKELALEKEKQRKEEAERVRLAALEKQRREIEEEIKKNEVLIENFETQLKNTCALLENKPDNEKLNLLNKEREYITQKMKHVEIVKALTQKLSAMK